MNRFAEIIREALIRRARPTNLSPYTRSTSWVTLDGHMQEWGTKGQWSYARRGPLFVPLFTAIVGPGGFTLFGQTVLYAQVLSAIATTAITVGLQMLLAPEAPKPEDGRQPLTQSIPAPFWCIGKNRLAGAYSLWEAKDNLLFAVHAVAGHKVNAFTGFYLNDDLITFKMDGFTVEEINNRYDDDKVRIYSRLGEVPETAYEAIVAELGGAGIWTNNHRGDGTASMAMIAKAASAEGMSKSYPYGRPTLNGVVEGALVWDFRDPAQDPDDPATWVYSRNSALLLCWHECFNPFGSKRDFRKAILPVLDMWQEEADVCDENVPLAIGGTEKRYECNGFDAASRDPKVGTNAILATMDGWMCERGDGALLLVAGKFREKYVATLTDEEVSGHFVQNDVLFEEEINRLIPTFTYPATDYTSTETDYFEDVPAQAIAGRVLPKQDPRPYIHQWRQARRCSRREWQRLRQRKMGSIDVRLAGINAVYAPWIRLNTPARPTINGMLIANRRSELNLLAGAFKLTWQKMPDNGADIDAWTPATDEGMAPPIPIKPMSDGIPIPDVDAIAAVANAGSVYLRVSIIDPQREDLVPVVRYRIDDTGGGTSGAWVEHKFPEVTPAAGLLVLNTPPVPNDELLNWQVAFIGGDNTYGQWTIAEDILATVNTVPPDDLEAVSVTGGLGYFEVEFDTPLSNVPAYVVIYKVPTGTTIDVNDPTHNFDEIEVAPGDNYPLGYGDPGITNALANSTFGSPSGLTLGTGWSVGSGIATKAAAGAGSMVQTPTGLSGSTAYWRLAYRALTLTAGNLRARLNGMGSGAQFLGTYRSTAGIHFARLLAGGSNTSTSIEGDASSAGTVDDWVAFAETVDCEDQGVFDFRIVPYNSSHIPGTAVDVTGVVVY